MLQCVAVCCNALQCVAVCCGVLQCVAVCRRERPEEAKSKTWCCSALQCVAERVQKRVVVRFVVAACCSMLQYVAVCSREDAEEDSIKTSCHAWLIRVLQCVAACCSVLQCVAVCCSVLQKGYQALMSHMTYLCVWHDAFICVMWCVRTCDTHRDHMAV